MFRSLVFSVLIIALAVILPGQTKAADALKMPMQKGSDYDEDGIDYFDDICPADAENDADGDGVCGAILGDFDNNGCVDLSDIPIFVPAYLGGFSPADLYGDGLVNMSDLTIMAGQIGHCADNCPYVPNEDQQDSDGDGLGDACDADLPIWIPAPETTWQIQLQGSVDTGYVRDAYDIDLFDSPETLIDSLQAAGIKVICYFSAGSYESWRPDAELFVPGEDFGEDLPPPWNESWLNINSENVRAIMLSRMDLAAAKGCDAVDPDNVDAYTYDTGFPLSEADQINYNTFLAESAHERGLAVGLKNAVELAEELEPLFDFAVNENCLDYNECFGLMPFINADKAVFHIEYAESEAEMEIVRDEVCSDPGRPGQFSTLTKLITLYHTNLTCDE